MRERSFHARRVRKTDNLKKANRTTSHTHSARPACSARPARPSCPARPAALPASHVLHTTRPTYAHFLRSSLYRVHHAPIGLLCVLYALCQQPGTENTKYAEKRHEVAKCQRFGAVNRPQIIEIMFSCLASCCVSVRNVLIDWEIVKWLDKRPF